jgi:hypothetical protein
MMGTALGAGADTSEGFRLVALVVEIACITGSSSFQAGKTDCHTFLSWGRLQRLLWLGRRRSTRLAEFGVGIVGARSRRNGCRIGCCAAGRQLLGCPCSPPSGLCRTNSRCGSRSRFLAVVLCRELSHGFCQILCIRCCHLLGTVCSPLAVEEGRPG